MTAFAAQLAVRPGYPVIGPRLLFEVSCSMIIIHSGPFIFCALSTTLRIKKFGLRMLGKVDPLGTGAPIQCLKFIPHPFEQLSGFLVTPFKYYNRQTGVKTGKCDFA